VLAPTKKKAEAMAEAREARGRRDREAAEHDDVHDEELQPEAPPTEPTPEG